MPLEYQIHILKDPVKSTFFSTARATLHWRQCLAQSGCTAVLLNSCLLTFALRYMTHCEEKTWKILGMRLRRVRFGCSREGDLRAIFTSAEQERLMAPPNATWMEVIGQAKQRAEVLKDPEAIRNMQARLSMI